MSLDAHFIPDRYHVSLLNTGLRVKRDGEGLPILFLSIAQKTLLNAPEKMS